MDRPNIPLNALRAFEAAARHLTLSKAAIELCVTQAALSHQIRNLEERLGVQMTTAEEVDRTLDDHADDDGQEERVDDEEGPALLEQFT